MANAARVDVRDNFMASVQAEASLVASHISPVALKLLLYVRLRYSLTVSAGNDEGIYLSHHEIAILCQVRKLRVPHIIDELRLEGWLICQGGRGRAKTCLRPILYRDTVFKPFMFSAPVPRNRSSLPVDVEWEQLKRYCGNCCLACRVRETYDEPLAHDHIIPRSKGSLDSIHNIQPLCRSCNSRKGTTTVDYRAGYQQFLLDANTPSEAWLQAKLLQPDNVLPVPTHPHFKADEDQVQLASSRLRQNYQPE